MKEDKTSEIYILEMGKNLNEEAMSRLQAEIIIQSIIQYLRQHDY